MTLRQLSYALVWLGFFVILAQANAAELHKGAVLAGDFPDPSVIRVGKTFYSSATTSAWAPAFTLMSSQDLTNWKQIGAVFQKPPDWTNGSYWAPEIRQLGKTFYIYYSAKDKVTRNICIGVATAPAPQGPYTDHGQVVCHSLGAIDAAVVEDGQNGKYMIWKEDGNSARLPTPLRIQKLSADGLHLVGDRKEVIRNDATWEGELVEAPYIIKHGDYWYVFYSGNACCGRVCNYAVGVARAKELMGTWEKNPQNPILQSNDTWKCPGHGSIVTDEQGRDIFLYHAYHNKDSVYVGRQMMADQVIWGTSGWPSINNGRGPSSHLSGFLGHPLNNKENFFRDDFKSQTLNPGWQWPHENEPVVSVGKGLLTLRITSVPGSLPAPAAGVIARMTTSSDYTAQVQVPIAKISNSTSAGLAIYGEPGNAIGASYSPGEVELWRQDNSKFTSLGSWKLTTEQMGDATAELDLRATVSDGRHIQFAYATTQATRAGKLPLVWTDLGSEKDGYYLPPWDLGVRVALTAGGTRDSEAKFTLFSIKANAASVH